MDQDRNGSKGTSSFARVVDTVPPWEPYGRQYLWLTNDHSRPKSTVYLIPLVMVSVVEHFSLLHLPNRTQCAQFCAQGPFLLSLVRTVTPLSSYSPFSPLKQVLPPSQFLSHPTPVPVFLSYTPSFHDSWPQSHGTPFHRSSSVDRVSLK